MRFPAVVTWLIDEAATVGGADQFLAALGAELIATGLPLAGGALTLEAGHPIIARRVWLWRAETGVVIEVLGFGSLSLAEPAKGQVGRDWLSKLGAGLVQHHVVGPGADRQTPTGPASGNPMLSWALLRRLAQDESALLHEVARFAAAPLAVLSARSTLIALLEAYLGRRSAGQVLAGRLRREIGETNRAVMLYGDLRDRTSVE